MKKILSWILVLCMCLCALGENELAGGMAKVTGIVKETLDIPDDYGEFSGDLSDGLWWLYWSTDEKWLEVLCDTEGRVQYYYCGDNERMGSNVSSGFPQMKAEQLTDCCKAFLDRVVTGENWGWELPPIRDSLNHYGEAIYLNGMLTYRGLPTDIGFSLSVSTRDGKVFGFSRTDNYMKYASRVEEGRSVTAETAKELLTGTYAQRPVYRVVQNGEMARPVYVRVQPGEKAVRACDGEIVDRARFFDDNGAVEEAAEDMVASKATGAMRALTEAELKGVSRYDGALTGEALDALLRQNSYLKLTADYRFTGPDYYAGEEMLTAEMLYTRTTEDGVDIYKNISVDALSGQILAMFSYSDSDRRDPEPADTDAWKETAENFVKSNFPELMEEVTLTDSVKGYTFVNADTSRYIFARVHEGLLFEDNYVAISVDGEEGSVIAVERCWNNGQEFYASEPEKFIGEEAARNAWMENAVLSEIYLSLPDEDNVYTLTLCYAYTGCEQVNAVDAHNGQRYGEPAQRDTAYTYENEADMLYAEEIRVLGVYGIGLGDCGFTDQDFCTPEQLMHLLLQAKGMESGETPDDGELAKRFESAFGTLPEAGADGFITRGEMFRLAVICAGYERAASLSGIFTCPAADFDAINEESKGYAAIAWALGCADTDENGRLRPEAPALTAEAAHAVYVLLSRGI